VEKSRCGEKEMGGKVRGGKEKKRVISTLLKNPARGGFCTVALRSNLAEGGECRKTPEDWTSVLLGMRGGNGGFSQ